MSNVRLSARMGRIKPFIVMDVVKAACALELETPPPADPVLHLEIGQPYGAPPPAVVAALAKCTPAMLRYSNALGAADLREAVARHYARWYDVQLTGADVAIAAGASGAFVVTFAAAFDAGDRVAIASPGYPCYRHILSAFDVQIAVIETDATRNFQPTMAQLRATHEKAKLAGVVIASPSNPAGSIISLTELEDVGTFCKDNNIIMIVDEVYQGISRAPLASAMQLQLDGAPIVVIGSLSKYWCMTGFRIGWAVTRNAPIIAALERCIQNMAICAPTPCQHSGVVALSGACDEELNERVSCYFKAADALVERLVQVGFDAFSPAGAFYVYAECRDVCQRVGATGATQLCDMLLRHCRVACTPGVDFDEDRGEDFVRLSCSQAVEDVTEAGDRIAKFVNKFPLVECTTKTSTA